MCLYGVTGRSGQYYSQTSDNVLTGRCQGPVTTDRMRPVPFSPHWMLTVLDRTLDPQGPVSTDRTRPVTFFPHWNLTVLDRTLDPQGPVSIDRTRPIIDSLFWNLTRVDWTLHLSVRSLDHSAFGRTRRNLLDQMN